MISCLNIHVLNQYGVGRQSSFIPKKIIIFEGNATKTGNTGAKSSFTAD